MRCSSSADILLIEKDDNNNCSVVKALKVRDGSPLDVPMIQFGSSKTKGRHVYLAEKSNEDFEIRKVNELRDVSSEIFKNRVFICNQNQYKTLMESMDVKERTARPYIKFMPTTESLKTPQMRWNSA